jgi:hypothetical protein
MIHHLTFLPSEKDVAVREDEVGDLAMPRMVVVPAEAGISGGWRI